MNSMFESAGGFFVWTSQLLSSFFVLIVGVVIIMTTVMYLIDRFQTAHTIRRNYPLLGRFRYLFERLGEFFRQYFFPWTVKKCHLTAPRDPGCTGQQKTSTILRPLAPP